MIENTPNNLQVQEANQTTTQNSAAILNQAPKADETGNKLKLIFTFLILIILFSSIYSYTKIYLKNREVVDLNKTTVTSNGIGYDTQKNKFESFQESSSAQNQGKYLAEIESSLTNPSLIEENKKALLLRKAIALSTVRSNNPTNIVAANSILKTLITTSNGKTESDLYMRDFAIVAFEESNFQNISFNNVKDTFPEIFKKYSDKNYPETVSVLLSLNEISNLVSAQRKLDISLISVSVLIKSELLLNYKNNLSERDTQLVLDGLRKDLSLFKDAKPLTFKNETRVGILPYLYYSYGYDAYNSSINRNLSSEMNEEINRNYDNVITLIENSTTTDKIGVNVMNIYNSMRYMTSINRRYGDNVDKSKLNTIVTNTLNSINYSQETKDIADMYIKENINNNNYRNWSYFISLGRTRDDVNKYLESIGIYIRK